MIFFRNFRSVSNLSFISKVNEKVALRHLFDHMNTNNLLDPVQSAHWAGYGTETALLRICNDIKASVDEGAGRFSSAR